MIDNTKEYIICAAIWYNDGISRDDEQKKLENGEKRTFPAHFRGATYQNKNISTGFVIGQWRHGNVISILPTNPAMNGGMKVCQGFLTSTGRFVDRWQGMYLAWTVGQVDSETALNKNYSNYNKNIVKDEYDIYNAIDILKGFDITEFMESKPTDDRFHEDIPFNMMYSEDLY